MYPYEIIFDLGLYEILLVLGFFGALLNFRFFADRVGFGAKYQNLCITSALAALLGGYVSAVLFQAVYNALESGVWEVTETTGATFYGGLIGGAGVFLLVYFIVGRFLLAKRETLTNFRPLANIAAGSIAVAHGLGRLGCLFAGCCHGAVTDAWYGVYHVYLGAKAVPVQLYEAIFLLALFGFLTVRLWKGKKYNMPIYLITYAVWRFLAEFIRRDDRGASIIDALTPSQFIAVVLLLVGVVWWLLELRADRGEEQAHEA